MNNKELVESIRKDLGIVDEKLKSESIMEAYVALPKQYELMTEFLSTKAKVAHKEIYESYAASLSRISAELDAVDKKENHKRYHELKNEEIYYMNAVHLHELFFANVSDQQSEINMDTLSYMRLTRDFGNFDRWQFDFVAAAQGQGNGWAVCAYSTFLRRFINFHIQSHNSSIPVGCYPVIVLDTWEHVYFRDYMTDRKAYIYAMMKELNWTIIEERIKRADKIGEALR